jgi:hypothetical protein
MDFTFTVTLQGVAQAVCILFTLLCLGHAGSDFCKNYNHWGWLAAFGLMAIVLYFAGTFSCFIPSLGG